MRVLIVDLDRVGSLGWYCARAFRKLGHAVYTHDLERRPEPGEANKQRLRTFVARQAPFLARRIVAARNRGLVEKTRSLKPDLLLVIKGRLVLPGTLGELRRLKGRPLLVNWYPDAVLDLNSEEVLSAVRGYDLLFFKEKNIISHLTKLGLANVHYLPHCTDPEIHRPVDLSADLEAKYRCDIAYAGHMYPYKAAFLASLADLDMKIYGIGWERLGAGHPLQPLWYGGPVFGEDLTHAFNAAKVVLNLHQHSECFGVHQRVFDAAGCGAFQVSDDRPGLTEFFSPGKDLLTYRSPEELREILAACLPAKEDRERMGRRTMEKVRARHTYVHRIGEILDRAGHP